MRKNTESVNGKNRNIRNGIVNPIICKFPLIVIIGEVYE